MTDSKRYGAKEELDDRTKIFEAFDNYPFETDQYFQAGVQTMKLDELQQAKYFYYNKFIKPFDISEYETWKEAETRIKNETQHSSLSFHVLKN